MIKINQKVVCIKADWKPKLFVPVEFPIMGEIYHVDEVVEVEGYGTCLKLRELIKTDTVWRAENFRPVDYSVGETVEERIQEELQREKRQRDVFLPEGEQIFKPSKKDRERAKKVLGR